jgi:hypothetical protein
MKQAFSSMLMICSLAALAMTIALASCDEDDTECLQEDVDACLSSYDECHDGLDVTADSYMDDLAACVASYCDCVESAGCEVVGNYDCGN